MVTQRQFGYTLNITMLTDIFPKNSTNCLFYFNVIFVYIKCQQQNPATYLHFPNVTGLFRLAKRKTALSCLLNQTAKSMGNFFRINRT